MDFVALRNIFENKYQRADWIKVLREVFNISDVFTKPRDTGINKDEWDAKVYQLGEFKTLEGLLIGIYEVPINNTVKLERNKVGLRNLLKNIYREDVDAAFVVFNQGNKWRFSYVSEITVKDPTTGKRVKKATDPKRYTYILGKGERAKTAADNFLKIKTTEDLFGKGVRLQAIEDAFNVERMSKAFFDEYRKRYGAFTAYLTGKDENNKVVREAHPFLKSFFNGDEKEARDFVKKMMGRLVFLYFLEKKGWLGVPEKDEWGEGDDNFLSNLFRDCKHPATFYSDVLVPLFFDTLNTKRSHNLFKIDPNVFKTGNYDKLKIPFLNGGLFDNPDKRTDNLVFDEADFRKTFTFFDQYNFTVYEDSPDEHTVAVDPEMLGHIFENLLEDNKDKGAFYTPKEIVHYMCQESLIEYLCTKLDGSVERTDLERFIKHQEGSGIANYTEEVLQALYDVKVCDPAIGSGAFPMGILMEILHAVETLHYLNDDVTNRVWELEKWEPAQVKAKIIQHSIYGVDIEQGAVDIARLRFWLSLVVDEEEPQPLPNLDYKIVVGNSLVSKFEDQIIEIDWDLVIPGAVTDEVKKIRNIQKGVQDKLKLLFEKQDQFFNYDGDKVMLKEEIRLLKINVLIEQLQLNIAKENLNATQVKLFDKEQKKNKKTIEKLTQKMAVESAIIKLTRLKNSPNLPLHFFDWKFDFPEVMNDQSIGNIGFDIIIANPPYVSAMALKKLVTDREYEYLKQKFDTAKGTVDLYIYFMELGLKLLATKGELAYITPNRYLSASYGTALREMIYKTSKIKSIVDYSDVKVFKEASVYPILSFLQHEKKTNYTIKIGKYNEQTQDIDLTYKSSDKLELLEGFLWGYLLNDKITLTEKVISQGVSLTLACKINATSTTSEADEYHNLINETEGYKLINTGTIDRYSNLWGKQELVDKGEKYLHPYLPINSDIISSNRKRLYASEKIILAKIAIRAEGFYDYDGEYASVNTNCLHSFSDKFKAGYVLAWINSKLFQYTFECFFEGLKMQGGYLLYSAPNLSCTFIKEAPKEIQSLFTILTSYIQFLKKQSLLEVSDKLMPTYFEQIIDGMVYEVYLTDLLKKNSRDIIKHLGDLPKIKITEPDEGNIDIIRGVFNRLNDKNHIVRTNLFYMDSIPEIREIEGKNEGN